MKKFLTAILIIVVGFNLTLCSQKGGNKETMVVIHTEMGDMKLKLYNETPKHRDNFVKLIKEGWYDQSPFHRIIEGFMIQGGQNADGSQGPGYTVDAEFIPKYFHKKGALAAARMGDNVNPQKKSSGSQFYIVQGKTFTDQELEYMTSKMRRIFTEEQVEAYKTAGGTPHLDGEYTVFGELVEGIDVLDKIAAVTTGPGDKPVKDVTMTIEVIK